MDSRRSIPAGAVMSTLASKPKSEPHKPNAPGGHLVSRLGRYEIRSRVDRRGPVEWFSGIQHEGGREIPVRIGREPALLSGLAPASEWPSIAWELNLRGRAQHVGLPRILDQFLDGQHAYLVLEDPVGRSLWEAWDAPNIGRKEQFGWLCQLAELIRAVHRAAALTECLRPEFIRISPMGHVVLSPDATFIPLPPHVGALVHPHLTSAPELVLRKPIDARADLYHFGTVLYALELGRELTELEFEAPGRLKSALAHDPNLHPCLGRLLARTLAFERGNRFPSEETHDDLSGFGELVRTLQRAQSVLSRARLDVSAWTTTGMVRGNNEDAVAILHGSTQREGADDDWAFIALADGLGGNAAGEVAAAMTIQTLSQCWVQARSLRNPSIGAASEPHSASWDVAGAMVAALQEANRAVYLAGRSEHRHGMGCTAEAVSVDGEQVVVGHVGDSRTYRFRRGALEQLTHDQTFLAELVAQRQIAAEDLRMHPRRGELMQAIGGRPTVEPEVARATFGPGDWLVVCSDGLTARVPEEQIVEILETATSAESAARRLVNRANNAGAADNVTVAVVRGC